ncbi:hypothetical protein [Streptomyces zagrosensis]|uniref:hypothetical protein n=1 Tax=Streptomyces zagrosensis TaxID=1042984 RepID=UPI00161AF181
MNLVEAVDHVPDNVFIGLHQLGADQYPMAVGRAEAQQRHRAPIAHRSRAAPVHDLLQLLPLLLGQAATPTGSATAPPEGGTNITAHPTASTTDLVYLLGHSTSVLRQKWRL